MTVKDNEIETPCTLITYHSQQPTATITNCKHYKKLIKTLLLGKHLSEHLSVQESKIVFGSIHFFTN